MTSVDREIYDLILRYFNFGKTVDDDYYRELLRIVVKGESLESYIKEIKFDEEVPGGFYTYSERQISIDIRSSSIFANREARLFRFFDEEKRLAKLLICAHLLLHEVEHAKQFKLLDSSTDSVEYEILKASNLEHELVSREDYSEDNELLESMLGMWQSRYYKYYTFCPEERMADIGSYKRCYELSKNMGSIALRVSDYLLYSLYLSYLKGYDEISNPTKFYLSRINPKFDYAIIESSLGDVSVGERFYYGIDVPLGAKKILHRKSKALLMRSKR